MSWQSHPKSFHSLQEKSRGAVDYIAMIPAQRPSLSLPLTTWARLQGRGGTTLCSLVKSSRICSLSHPSQPCQRSTSWSSRLLKRFRFQTDSRTLDDFWLAGDLLGNVYSKVISVSSSPSSKEFSICLPVYGQKQLLGKIHFASLPSFGQWVTKLQFNLAGEERLDVFICQSCSKHKHTIFGALRQQIDEMGKGVCATLQSAQRWLCGNGRCFGWAAHRYWFTYHKWKRSTAGQKHCAHITIHIDAYFI